MTSTPPIPENDLADLQHYTEFMFQRLENMIKTDKGKATATDSALRGQVLALVAVQAVSVRMLSMHPAIGAQFLTNFHEVLREVLCGVRKHTSSRLKGEPSDPRVLGFMETLSYIQEVIDNESNNDAGKITDAD